MTYMVIATLNYGSAEQRTKVVPLLKAHQKRSLENEPGTLRFDFGLSEDDPKQVLFEELYTSKAAFEAHMEAESIKLFNGACEERGIEVTIEGWRGTMVE